VDAWVEQRLGTVVTIAASLMVSHAIFTIQPLRFEFDEFIQIRLSHRETIFLSKLL
jgi:hypothetical protein